MPRASDAKERLMAAAMELIWEQSYGSTSVDAICDKAGVKKGSFYYFFDSKSDLAVEALEAQWQVKKVELDRIFSPVVPPLERIQNYLKWLCERQAELHRERGYVLGCPLFSLGSEVSTQDEAIRGKVEEILDRNIRYFESAIRDADGQHLVAAPDARAKAKVLFAYVQGLLTEARIKNCLDGLGDLEAGAMEVLGFGKVGMVKAGS